MTKLNRYRSMLIAGEAELSGTLALRDAIEVHRSPDSLDDTQLAAERDFAVSYLV